MAVAWAGWERGGWQEVREDRPLRDVQGPPCLHPADPEAWPAQPSRGGPKLYRGP